MGVLRGVNLASGSKLGLSLHAWRHKASEFQGLKRFGSFKWSGTNEPFGELNLLTSCESKRNSLFRNQRTAQPHIRPPGDAVVLKTGGASKQGILVALRLHRKRQLVGHEIAHRMCYVALNLVKFHFSIFQISSNSTPTIPFDADSHFLHSGAGGVA